MSLGADSARKVSKKINDLLSRQKFVNVVFAAAPSQSEFLASLSQQDVDWQRVNAFHMDEYLGLPLNAKQRFGNFLKDRIFDKASFRSVNYLLNNTADPDAECERIRQTIDTSPS